MLLYSISLVSGARTLSAHVHILRTVFQCDLSEITGARSVLLPYDTGVTSLEDSSFKTKFKDKYYLLPVTNKIK